MNDPSWLGKQLQGLRTQLRAVRSRSQAQRIGDQAEDQALVYLQQAGLQLIQRNFLCKGGEIDLIMRDGNVLVFVEVRKRQSAQFGGAAASITPAKQQRLTHAAQVYLQTIKALPACRFDALLIQGDQLSWLKNIIS